MGALSSYLEIFIPRVLDALDRLQLKITFFIVGQDAANDKNIDALKLLQQREHEIGNHSFHHEPWLHRYPKSRLKREILEAEAHILRVTGEKLMGFRGPGFTWSHDLMDVLSDAGYLKRTIKLGLTLKRPDELHHMPKAGSTCISGKWFRDFRMC